MRAALLALIGGLAFAGSAAAAPPFQLALIDGSGWVAPGRLNNHPSVLLFWDSRCPPCLVELTNVAALQRQFPEAVFVAVSLSSRDESRRIFARANLPETVICARAPSNPQGLLASLGNASGVLPFAAMFNTDGKQCASISGALSTNRAAAARLQCLDRSG